MTEQPLEEKEKPRSNDYTIPQFYDSSSAGLAYWPHMNMYAANNSYAYLGYPTFAKPKTLN